MFHVAVCRAPLKMNKCRNGGFVVEQKSKILKTHLIKLRMKKEKEIHKKKQVFHAFLVRR